LVITNAEESHSFVRQDDSEIMRSAVRQPLVVPFVLAALLTGWKALAATDQDAGAHPFMQQWETDTGSCVSWFTVKSGTNLFLVAETANNIPAGTSATSTTNGSGRPGASAAEATNKDPFEYYTRQTKKMIDAYAPGRAISNWDSLEILPLTKSTNGFPTTINLTGTTTLRLTIPGSPAAPDCAVFRSEACATNRPASFTSFTISADGKNLTLVYSGTLQWASALSGPWTNVLNAVGPYTAPFAVQGSLFYQVH
jgi:hypothetical protein